MPRTLAEALRNSLERRLTRLWFAQSGSRTDSLLRLLLRPLARITLRIASRRRQRIRRLPVAISPAVVVVGNLVVGGTGKTPLVIALARALHARGYRVGLIARGYRAELTAARMVNASSNAEEHGDEPVLLASQTGLPVAAAANRLEALQLLETVSPDLQIVISDDGLQHVNLPRTLELAVFDSRELGNAELLPAGPLREPAAHALQMDAWLLNGDAALPAPLSQTPDAAGKTFRFRVAPDLFRPVGNNTPQPAELRALSANEFVLMAGGRQIAALAGIGNPDRFFAALRKMGLTISEYPLPDHARIDPHWLASLAEPLIVMTAKDAVKCQTFADERCWMLDVRAHVDPALIDWLEERLHGSPIA